MWSVVHFKSNQSVLLFKMIASLVFLFIVSSLTSATNEDAKCVTSTCGKEAKICFLPPYPQHGRYTVSNYPFATPGDSYQYVKLDVTCDLGYLNNSTIKSIFCINGEWSATMPRCFPNSDFCTLYDDLKVEYRCLSVSGSLEPSQECPSLVPSGTSVRPICRSPAYFSLKALSEMHCRDGIWDYSPICKPACGLITQHRKLEGSSTNHVELPWYAVIYYKKNSELYTQHCCGSLITANKIISAAICFTDYDGKLQPASNYLVAVNKMYLKYNDPRDVNSQQSNVVDIRIPSSFRGNATDYTDNIAIVIVERPFIFHLSVRPVCLDFDNNLDRTQLTKGNSGKVSQWSYVNNNGRRSRVLNVHDLQYIKLEDCYEMWPTRYRQFLSNDKFCAISDDTLRPHYEQGAGIAFLESTTQRYYLRGVIFYLLPIRDNEKFVCTSIVKHEHFIKQYL